MSKVEELLAKYNSNGISTIKLADILDYEQPSKYIVSSSEYDDNYEIPVLTAGQSFILGYTDEKDGVYKASKNNPTIIFDDFTTGHHWVDFDFKIKSSAMKMLKLKNNKSLLRYIFHSMALINYVPTEHSRQWISKYSQFEIPLPHIKVQEEIVKILDSFTNLIDALNEELSLRQKQFEYYREKLLTFDKCECEWKKLGDIAEIGTGRGNTNEGLNDGLYPFFTRGQDILWKNDYEFDEEAVITAGDGVGVGKVMHYINGKYSLHQRAYRFKPTKKLVTKFLYHYMKVTFFKYVCGNSVASSVSSLRKPQLIAYPIPIPSLAIQKSIVEKLDAFESLISSLKEEIALRQKQYEYYREKLLTFD